MASIGGAGTFIAHGRTWAHHQPTAACVMDAVALCRCGCGQPTPRARQRDRARGYEKGQQVQFVHGHHRRAQVVVAAAEPSPPAASVPAVRAPVANSVPAGVRPDIHARFWAAVERALEKARAELPPALLDPEADAAAGEPTEGDL
jgi:hypothetical protein